MRTRVTGATLAAVCGLAAAANSQTIDLYLVKTVDVSAFSSSTATNSTFIGNNVSSVAYGNNTVYLGGYFNSGAVPVGVTEAFNVQIGTLENFWTNVGPTQQSTIAASKRLVSGAGFGYLGLDYDATWGLLASCRVPASAADGHLARYLVDGVGSGPNSRTLIVGSNNPTPDLDVGIAGTCYDFGPTGLGFDYDADTVIDGPVVLMPEWGRGAPYGVRATSLDVNANFQFGPSPVPGVAPILGSPTSWRDYDVHPLNGAIVARTNNRVAGVNRTPTGAAAQIDYAPLDPASTLLPVAVTSTSDNVNIALLYNRTGSAADDAFIWNDRPQTISGQPFTSVVKINRFSDGAPVTINWRKPDGSALGFGIDLPDTGAGAYDFFWDQASKTLYISDFTNRNVYAFSTEQPGRCDLGTDDCIEINASLCTALGGTAFAAATTCPVFVPCPLNFDDSGGSAGVIDLADLNAFFDAWGQANGTACGDPCPLNFDDSGGSAGVIDLADLNAFFDAWGQANGTACP